MICLQTDQSQVKGFFYVTSGLLDWVTFRSLLGENGKQVIFSTQYSSVQAAYCCLSQENNYFKIELFNKTDNKYEN